MIVKREHQLIWRLVLLVVLPVLIPLAMFIGAAMGVKVLMSAVERNWTIRNNEEVNPWHN